MEREQQERLWEAINAYVLSCGGRPNAGVYGATTRQKSVEAVEDAVADIARAAHSSGYMEAYGAGS
jgi:hypothetical protein